MQAQPGLWRRTPPAIFPPIMGLFGLGLGWRVGAGAFGLPAGLAEALLGGVTLLFLFAAGAWLAKPLRRPRVVIEDLRVLPGRAGLAAGSLCVMLLSAVMVPYGPGFALALVMAGLGLHALLAVLVAYALLTGPQEQRVVTPVFHLTFVGFIIAPLTLIPLGYAAMAQGILYATLPVAVAIWAASLWQIARRVPPAPLRPLLAIHLAPASLFCLVATGLGDTTLAALCAGLGAAILAALLVSVRWLVASGFSALWGAFTFPLAAFATALLGLGEVVGLRALTLGGGLVLVAATLIIPPIAVKVFQAWAKGGLAKATNAATA